MSDWVSLKVNKYVKVPYGTSSWLNVSGDGSLRAWPYWSSPQGQGQQFPIDSKSLMQGQGFLSRALNSLLSGCFRATSFKHVVLGSTGNRSMSMTMGVWWVVVGLEGRVGVGIASCLGRGCGDGGGVGLDHITSLLSPSRAPYYLIWSGLDQY